MRIGPGLCAVFLAAVFALAAALPVATAEPRSGAAPSVTEQTLYSFCPNTSRNCADGAFPSGLIMDAAGNLYGTTTEGGEGGGGADLCNGIGCGTVFQLTPTGTGWSEKVLYSFCPQSNCADGAIPYAGLIMDGSGNLYGTSVRGGIGVGTVFQLRPIDTGWTETVLYSFGSQSADGYFPYAGLIMDGAGNLYGTTSAGGANHWGTVFQLTPTGSGWSEQVLYSFCSQFQCADGASPYAGLIMDASGNLYGTTPDTGGGAPYGFGTVFKLTLTQTGWTETVLYHFCSQSNCVDGAWPYAGLVMDASGNLYGTTARGGANSYGFGGTVFQLTPTDTEWSEKVLYSFGSPFLAYSPYTLIMDGAGIFYGTAGGGNSGWGTVFQLTPTGTGWSGNVLYSFCSRSNCADGTGPNGLIMDGAGNLYGTTGNGGNDLDAGTVFALNLGTPIIYAVSPSSGAVGTTITITGANFTTDNNTVQFDGGYIQWLSAASSSNGRQTIAFTLPPVIGALACPGTIRCPTAAHFVSPGTNNVSVQNANGSSNPMTFTVTN